MARHRLRVLLLGVTALSACSPYVYNPEITGFSTGVDDLAASYRSGQRAVDGIIAQQRQTAEVAARTRLLLLPGCDQTDPSGTPPTLPDCAAVSFVAPVAPAPTAVQQHVADAAPAFDALKAYAAALVAVTAAADETAVNQATQSLTTAAGAVAGELAKLQPATVRADPLVAPVGSMLGQGIAIWLDQLRLAALRNTVPAVDPEVRSLGQTLQAALAEIRAQQLLQLGRDLRADAEALEGPAVGTLSVDDYQGKRAALDVEIAAFNQVRAADPAATVGALVTAHHQLALALQANIGQATAVATGVQTFIAAAEKLRTAIGAIAVPKPPVVARK
jgi:hypothetical protein